MTYKLEILFLQWVSIADRPCLSERIGSSNEGLYLLDWWITESLSASENAR